jgi:hypothetical protein
LPGRRAAGPGFTRPRKGGINHQPNISRIAKGILLPKLLATTQILVLGAHFAIQPRMLAYSSIKMQEKLTELRTRYRN